MAGTSKEVNDCHSVTTKYFVTTVLLSLFFFVNNLNVYSKDFFDTIKTRRSVRQFKQVPINPDLLDKIVDAARYAPSGGNRQPWEFVLVSDKTLCSVVFANTAWLKSAGKPVTGKEPVAYIVVLGNPKLSGCYLEDCAAATQNILLAAWAEGVGSCWIGSVTAKNVKPLLDIPPGIELTAVIALGYPDETAVAVDRQVDESVTPVRDDKQVLKVPKKGLNEIRYINKYRKKVK
ncbi:MAG: nitroreductase family protein [Elusimicrobiota bacterium]